MSCGLTRLVSRIKLMLYVMRHKEWKCLPIPTCVTCEYWETCYYEYQVETDKIEEIVADPVEDANEYLDWLDQFR